jgi:UbiA prenyltransferase family
MAAADELKARLNHQSNIDRKIYNFIYRLWIYQKERFPIVKHGLLIAVFGSSAVGYSFLLRGASGIPNITSLIVAFVCIFLFFLQLRIADEFKDFAQDVLYRSYRPVPRGLVSLKELRWVGVASAILQLGLTIYLAPSLVLVLGLVWFYLALMRQEFFVVDWLKSHPIIYMLSHMIIVPLINLYGTACDWLVAGTTLEINGFWFLLASFFNGMVIEIGRKIRAIDDEEFGVETYSKLWGYRNAVVVWLLVVGLTGITAWGAAVQINFTNPVVYCLGILFCFVAGVAGCFIYKPVTKWADLIDSMSGIWTLCVYLFLGILPIIWRF